MKISIKDVIQQIRPFFIAYLILLCGCFIIKLFFTKDDIYFAVNIRHTDFLDTIEPYITDLGDGLTIIIIAAFIALYNYRVAFLMTTTFLFTSLAVQIAKFFFDAPRPKLYFKDELSELHFVKGVNVLSNHSFPSGHTLTAFATGVLITYLVKNKSWSILLLFYGIMVGFSRVYLSQHFFEDVVGGSAMGVFLAIFWIGLIDSRKFINSPGWSRGLFR